MQGRGAFEPNIFNSFLNTSELINLGLLSSVVERLSHEQEVPSSTLGAAIFFETILIKNTIPQHILNYSFARRTKLNINYS